MTIKDLKLAQSKFKTDDDDVNLPGREDKIHELESFLIERLKTRQTVAEKRARVQAGTVANINKHCNNTVFVCGVPGTGKTAVVMKVVKMLHDKSKTKNSPLRRFQYHYVNGQHVTEPVKIYTEIYHKMTGIHAVPEKAQKQLDKLFNPSGNASSEKKRATRDVDAFHAVIIDELDLLYNERRLQVFYNLFDWPTTSDSRLILITIANAMDLPERFARGRISSRIGWDKIVFEPYRSEHLETILGARLGKALMDKCFDRNAILVATKRIGKTTGDARRIIDTCCLAIDEAIAQNSPKVTAKIVDSVGFQNLDRMKLDYVQNCRPLELMILKGILKETESHGELNVTAYGVYKQVRQLQLNSKIPLLIDKVLDHDEFHGFLNLLMAVGLICLEGPNKNLMEKHLYIKDTSESFKDVIRHTKVNVDD